MKTFFRQPASLALAALSACLLASCQTRPQVASQNAGAPQLGSARDDMKNYGPGHATASYTPKGYGGKPVKFHYAPAGTPDYVPGAASGQQPATRTVYVAPYAYPAYPVYYGPHLGYSRYWW